MAKVLLILDGLALIGIVAFSVAAALSPDTRVYVVAQIVSAGVLLVSVVIQRRRGLLRNGQHEE